MNLISLQDNLKNLSDQQLQQEMLNPSGQVPSFLVLSELQRRKDMRSDYAARTQAPPQQSLAQQYTQPGGLAPQGGQQGLGGAAQGNYANAIRAAANPNQPLGGMMGQPMPNPMMTAPPGGQQGALQSPMGQAVQGFAGGGDVSATDETDGPDDEGPPDRSWTRGAGFAGLPNFTRPPVAPIGLAGFNGTSPVPWEATIGATMSPPQQAVEQGNLNHAVGPPPNAPPAVTEQDIHVMPRDLGMAPMPGAGLGDTDPNAYPRVGESAPGSSMTGPPGLPAGAPQQSGLPGGTSQTGHGSGLASAGGTNVGAMSLADYMKQLQGVEPPDRFANMEQSLKEDQARAGPMALAKAGFAMAAGNSPFAGQNIGAGAVAGLNSYDAAQNNIQKYMQQMDIARATNDTRRFDMAQRLVEMNQQAVLHHEDNQARLEQARITAGAGESYKTALLQMHEEDARMAREQHNADSIFRAYDANSKQARDYDLQADNLLSKWNSGINAGSPMSGETLNQYNYIKGLANESRRQAAISSNQLNALRDHINLRGGYPIPTAPPDQPPQTPGVAQWRYDPNTHTIVPNNSPQQ